MLNEHEEKRLNSIIEVIGTESWGQNSLADLNDVKWLIGIVLDLNVTIEELKLTIDQLEGRA